MARLVVVIPFHSRQAVNGFLADAAHGNILSVSLSLCLSLSLSAQLPAVDRLFHAGLLRRGHLK